MLEIKMKFLDAPIKRALLSTLLKYLVTSYLTTLAQISKDAMCASAMYLLVYLSMC